MKSIWESFISKKKIWIIISNETPKGISDMIILQLSQDELRIMLTDAAKQAVDQALQLAKDIQPERELTRRQIKEQYHVSYNTIHKAMNDGRLTFYRVGGRVMFKQTDVEKVFLKPIPAREFIKVKKD